MKKRKLLALALSAAMTVTILGGCGTSTPETSAAASTAEPVSTAATTAAAASTAETTAAPETKAAQKSYPLVTEDKENQGQYAAQETGAAAKFEWYKWEFEIDPEIDTVGEIGDGVGELYFRLFVPEGKDGEKYPLVAALGGLGSQNGMTAEINGYAFRGADYASDSNQAEHPCYVLTFQTPFEACVNYEAELEYVYQFGEVAKYVAETYGNVDLDRIYATGHSQGAGWSYELASVQPELLAAILINAGTTVHTTWGNQCDMEAIAGSDVNIYIWHGFNDPYIPVNEAYRAYHTLNKLGKNNIVMEIQDGNSVHSYGGHVNNDMTSPEETTKYMSWLFDQKKGVPCTESPELTEEGTYNGYAWAGVHVFSGIKDWATANDYASWTEPKENKTWDQVKENAPAFAEGEGGTGTTVLGKVRIGDETATSYDDAGKENPVVAIKAGDSAAITVQGYTGGYGDDWDAFQKEWSVDWAVLEGSVTNIELTHEASEKPIVRPETVTLANGGGPNVNNSLYNENTLDGKQVYVKIDTAENYEGDTLKVALRFTRDLGDGEYASYYHVVEFSVE